jgi:hypothetical protein
MSKGPGHLQRAILELIADNPNGAWRTSDICRHVYGKSAAVTKTQRVSVSRALRKMKLPGTWEIWRSNKRSGESWLCDPCDDESRYQVDLEPYGCDEWRRARREDACKEAATARRYRDGSPAERLVIDIERAKYQAQYYQALGSQTGVKQMNARIAEMKAELATMNEDATEDAA